MKRAYLFSFKYWYDKPPFYILVYAETEQEAREIGAKQCQYNNAKYAKPEDLKLMTFGL